MGKMGEAANLGAVAIAAFLVYKLVGLKLPKFELPSLPGLPTIEAPRLPRARDIYDIPDVIDDTLMVDVDPFIPAPTIADLGLPSAADLAAIAADHARRIAAGKAESATIISDLESQLAALQATSAELRGLVYGNADVDAGGSTDMDSSFTDVYWRTGRPIPI